MVFNNNFDSNEFSLDPEKFNLSMEPEANSSWMKEKKTSPVDLVIQRVTLPIRSQTDEEKKLELIEHNIQQGNKKLSEPQFYTKQVWKRVIADMSYEELQFSLNQKNSYSLLTKQLNQANENNNLFQKLKEKYGPPSVIAVFEKINENKQTQILSGKIDFNRYYEQFDDACREHYEKFSPQYNVHGNVLNQQELEEFLSSAKCIGYKEGFQGVYIFKGTVDGTEKVLAIKVPRKPKQELFGTKLISALGAQVPATDFISIQSNEGKKIADLIKSEQVKRPNENKHLPESCEGFMMMDRIEGKVWEDITTEDLKNSTKSEPESIDHILEDYGEMIIYDLLIYNRDRSPTLGMGNFDNLILVKEGEHFSSVVAIDQAAHLSNQGFSLSAQLGENPYERVSSIIKDILTGEQSATVKDLQECLDQNGFSDILEKNVMRRHILNGLHKGMEQIREFPPESIDIIYHEVEQRVSRKKANVDFVDVEAHKTMLSTMQKSVHEHSS